MTEQLIAKPRLSSDGRYEEYRIFQGEGRVATITHMKKTGRLHYDFYLVDFELDGREGRNENWLFNTPEEAFAQVKKEFSSSILIELELTA